MIFSKNIVKVLDREYDDDKRRNNHISKRIKTYNNTIVENKKCFTSVYFSLSICITIFQPMQVSVNSGRFFSVCCKFDIYNSRYIENDRRHVIAVNEFQILAPEWSRKCKISTFA